MYISKLKLVNYRNFASTTLLFNKGVNTVIGENGSGKSNLFRAIRLLLDDNMVRSSYRLDESDFHRGLGSWQGHWIIISLEFAEISADEAVQALFLHGTGAVEGTTIGAATYNLIFRPKKEVRLRLAALPIGDVEGLAAILRAISIADYETVFTGRSSADFSSAAFYREVVGDFQNVHFSEETEFPQIGARVPGFLSVAKEVSFTFIQALRDVVAEFHNNRTNPLLTLLKSKSGEISPTVFQPIVDQVKALNGSIEALEDVQTVRSNITETIKDAAGETYSPSSLSIKSDLPDEAEKLFQSLRLFVGESEGYEGAVHELSLGGANLIYLSLKLLEFKYQKAKQLIANFLLVEEPEAHIHTHIQKTLFDRIAYSDTQIIYSTHSTHISEVSNVANMNVLGWRNGRSEAFQPANGLSSDEVGNIQRYLDAVRSNLLFARSVLLVEGDAEEILLPILVKKVFGMSLDELGISLINIRSTGFTNVAVLFHESRIRKRCGIITDLDASFIDTNPVVGDPEVLTKRKSASRASHQKGAQRKVALDVYTAGNAWLATFYAHHTFEVELVGAGNTSKIVSTLSDIYKDPETIALSKAELESGLVAEYGERVLTMAAHVGKGWFSVLLGKKIDFQVVIPPYIRQAILYAHGRFSNELVFNILNYRVGCIAGTGTASIGTAADFRARLAQFRHGTIDFATIRTEMLAAFPADQINAILDGMA